jgi:hypothetical protein
MTEWMKLLKKMPLLKAIEITKDTPDKPSNKNS